MHGCGNTLIILLLGLVLFTTAQKYEWQYKNTSHSIPPLSETAEDFSPEAIEIGCTVTCDKECTVFLMTATEFKKMVEKQQYTYLERGQDVVSYIIELKNQTEIKKGLVVAVANDDLVENITAIWNMRQNVPTKSSINTPLLIGIIVAICACVCGVVCVALVGTLFRFLSNPLGVLFDDETQDYQRIDNEILEEGLEGENLQV